MTSPLGRRFLLAPAPPCVQTPLSSSVAVAFAGALCAVFLYLLLPFIYYCFHDYRQRPQRYGTHKRPPEGPTELCELPVAAYGSCLCRAGKASCSVCLDDYAEGDEVRVLPRCGHVFHRECIDRWLVTRSSLCPNVSQMRDRQARRGHSDGRMPERRVELRRSQFQPFPALT